MTGFSDAVRMGAALVVSGGFTLTLAAGVHVDRGIEKDEFQWVTIGDPGNRWTRPHETPLEPDRKFGKVNYRYRTSKYEVTNDQYFEFVLAYAPYVPQAHWGSSIFKSGATWTGVSNGAPTYTLAENLVNTPAAMSWHYAARYVNWLGNGKVNEPWAFETGAYDTSTFSSGPGPDGTITDQAFHTPGARYWIPSLDEWIKAVHWDPNAGEDGRYWRAPYGSDEAPVSGCPCEEGAQTNAGLEIPQYQDCPPGTDQVGRYPDAMTPWGLLDASGGVREMLEGLTGPSDSRRPVKGTDLAMGEFYWFHERLDVISSTPPHFSPTGLRLASVIPGPPVAALGLVFTLHFPRRRIR